VALVVLELLGVEEGDVLLDKKKFSLRSIPVPQAKRSGRDERKAFLTSRELNPIPPPSEPWPAKRSPEPSERRTRSRRRQSDCCYEGGRRRVIA
jgi:hypothetical protein